MDGCKEQESDVRTGWGDRIQLRGTLALALGLAVPAQACWDDAAARYQVNPTLLHAIARTESGVNPRAIGRNRNGSRDIGLMQINSGWLPTLARHGITEQDLFDPCTNLHVGAWILAHNSRSATWEPSAPTTQCVPTRGDPIDKVRRHLPVAHPAPAPVTSSPVSTRAR